MKKFIINEEQLNGLLQYLYKQPFENVANGVYMLQNLPVLNKEETEVKTIPIKKEE